MKNTPIAKKRIIKFKSTRILIYPIENQYLLWIEKNRRFLLVEEPIVYSLIIDADCLTTAQKLAARYELSIDECVSFVADVDTKFSNLLSESVIGVSSQINSTNIEIPQFEKTYLYKFLNNKIIKFSYQNRKLAGIIHPLLTHLETYESGKPNLCLELFENEQSLFLSSGKSSIKTWNRTDIPYFKGDIFGEILNTIHKKKDSDWMMTMHASAISNGESAIIFSAAAGGGKSTIAALLHANGYDLLSDDFTAIDLESNAYRFEMAISIKEDSLSTLSENFPIIHENEISTLSNGKRGCYIPPISTKYDGIFSRYSP